jgi:hypothetical protein
MSSFALNLLAQSKSFLELGFYFRDRPPHATAIHLVFNS